MIKLIVSDFDGCLLSFKEIHFNSLNKALATIDPKYVISYEDHVKTFDGLSTKKKLQMLNKTKGFPLDKVQEVNDLKQEFTCEAIDEFTNINYKIVDAVKKFKEEGYLFYVASNAVRKTIEKGLQKLGIFDLVDKIYSNEDVKHQKPHPEMYWECMVSANVLPHETLIIEDSKHGRECAQDSGAHLCEVDDSFDFTYDRIKSVINTIPEKNQKWYARNSTIVLIPMAGAGSRFAKQGFKLPKPLIEVNGKPMIKVVVDNLGIDAEYIFVVQKSHYEQYNLGTILPLLVPGCKIVQTEGLTEGAACTTLLCKEFINNDKHLLIANSDQFVEWDSSDFMYSALSSECDGFILTFKASGPKWSYVKLDDNNYVMEVAEKKEISDTATVGIYYYNKGSDYVKYAEDMIKNNLKVNNEFYVAPVYNLMIQDGKKVKTKNCKHMWGIGTPEDLEHFLLNYKG